MLGFFPIGVHACAFYTAAFAVTVRVCASGSVLVAFACETFSHRMVQSVQFTTINICTWHLESSFRLPTADPVAAQSATHTHAHRETLTYLSSTAGQTNVILDRRFD